MKLLLTSTGLRNAKVRDFFISQFETLSDKKVCLIFTVRQDSDWQWLDLYDKELKNIGLQYAKVNISEDKNLADIDGYDIYYVCGGNTFYILDRLRKTNMDKVIIREIEKGKWYIGVSAGSIIMGPDIEIAGIEGGDENDINLEDLQGCNLVPFHISPHFVEQERRCIEAFEKKRHAEVIMITDDQAVYVTEKEQVVIGS